MIITKPYKGESKQAFIIRCVSELSQTGTDTGDAVGMCSRSWDRSEQEDKGLNPLPFLGFGLWAKRTFRGIYSPTNLPQSLFNHTYLNTMSGVGLGFGLPEQFPNFTDRYDSALKYRQNIANFSGAKTFQQQSILSAAVFDEDGSKRTFKGFMEIAERHNINYNINYLRTEQNGAFKVAQSAEAWQQVVEAKDVLPYLKYVTVGDGLVRPEHASWDGIILPVDHVFWNTHYPPNDWNCRCIVVQLREGQVTNLKEHLKRYNASSSEDRQIKSIKNTSKVFANNPGKSGLIYGKSHPYFDIPNKYKKSALDNFGFMIPFDEEVLKTMKKVK